VVLGGGGVDVVEGGWVFGIEGTSTEVVTTLGNCGKSGNWRQYPPTELRGIAQWMEGGREKKWTLSLMVRLRGEGYDVALPWKFKKKPLRPAADWLRLLR
jgi:hypothetical protein